MWSRVAWLSVLLPLCFAHDCIHEAISHNVQIHHEPEPETKGEKGEFPIRFHLIYDSTSVCSSVGQVISSTNCAASTHTCTAGQIVTTDQYNYMVSVIDEAIEFFESTLTILASSGTMSYGSAMSCCGVTNPVPLEADANFLLYVRFHPTSGTTLAYAATCFVGENNRPTIGIMNLGSNQFSTIDGSERKEHLQTILHELTHALGFSSSFFQYWQKDGGGGTLVSYPLEERILSTTERGNAVTKLVTPNVLAWARDYFSCPTLNGVELENDGGAGTAGSHWEKRILDFDYMVGVTSGSQQITSMTLAAFRDMGFYPTVYEDHPLIVPGGFGEGQGCSFALDKCDTWDSRHFCSVSACTTEYIGCSVDGRHKGFCDLQTTSGIPSNEQYFGTSTLGGYFVSDYCPRIFSDQDCTSQYQTDVAAGQEVRGAESRCFVLRNTGIPPYACTPAKGAVCLERECIYSGETVITLRVHLDGTKYVDCDPAGGTISLPTATSSGYVGSIDCPIVNSGICTPGTGSVSTASATASATVPPSASATATATESATKSATVPPSASPTRPPSASPTRPPSASPTRPPSASPTRPPSASPTRPASASPTRPASASPTRPASPSSTQQSAGFGACAGVRMSVKVLGTAMSTVPGTEDQICFDAA